MAYFTQNELIKLIKEKRYNEIEREVDGTIRVLCDVYFFSPIEKLPDNLVISGNLDCHNISLNELPKNLVVSGYANFTRNNLKEIPECIKVGGYLNINDNKVSKIPPNLQIMSFFMCENNKISSFPDSLFVLSDLKCSNNNITNEIKSRIMGKIVMDDNTKKIYERNIKINNIEKNIN